LISQWCMTCPTRSTEFLCFFTLRLIIQCYSLKLRFHLDVCLRLLNFFKLSFPPTTPFNNKLFL
jgi:hypothetical protein